MTVHIDAAAWSIASVIAQAGQEVLMAANAQMMIHEPMALAFGPAEEHRHMAGLLEVQRGILLDTYMQRATVTREQMSDWVAAETWFTAPDALSAGLITGIDSPMQMAACGSSLINQFRRMPKNLRQTGADSRRNERLAQLAYMDRGITSRQQRGVA